MNDATRRRLEKTREYETRVLQALGHHPPTEEECRSMSLLASLAQHSSLWCVDNRTAPAHVFDDGERAWVVEGALVTKCVDRTALDRIHDGGDTRLLELVLEAWGRYPNARNIVDLVELIDAAR